MSAMYPSREQAQAAALDVVVKKAQVAQTLVQLRDQYSGEEREAVDNAVRNLLQDLLQYSRSFPWVNKPSPPAASASIPAQPITKREGSPWNNT